MVIGPDSAALPARGSSQSGILQIAGGTYNDDPFGLIGTTFLVNPIVPHGRIDFVDITGPAGWNGGDAFVCYPWQPPRATPTRSVCWIFTAPISGTYHATGYSGEDAFSADFSIDANTSLGLPAITKARLHRHRAQMQWNSPAGPGSFLIRINDWPFTGFEVDRVMPATARSVSISGLELDPDTQYQVVVFALSEDIRRGGVFPATFLMSSTDVFVQLPD